MRAPDGVRPGFGEAEGAYLARGDQLGHGPGGLLYRGTRVHPVLVVQVDVVGTQPPQRALHGGTDVGRAGIQVPGALSTVGDQTELGGQHHLVAAPLQGFPEEFLVGVGAVDLGRVDERDAEVQRPVHGPDRLRVVRAGARIAVGHPHRSQTDPGNLQVT